MKHKFIKYILVFSLILHFSCKNTKNLTPKDLKSGTFKTVLDNKTESFATRNKNIQIETFNNVKDTFLITWKSNFEYILKKTKPKNALDSTEFIVKITGIHKNSYSFKAYYKGSNYKQKGKAYKINNKY